MKLFFFTLAAVLAAIGWFALKGPANAPLVSDDRPTAPVHLRYGDLVLVRGTVSAGSNPHQLVIRCEPPESETKVQLSPERRMEIEQGMARSVDAYTGQAAVQRLAAAAKQQVDQETAQLQAAVHERIARTDASYGATYALIDGQVRTVPRPPVAAAHDSVVLSGYPTPDDAIAAGRINVLAAPVDRSGKAFTFSYVVDQKAPPLARAAASASSAPASFDQFGNRAPSSAPAVPTAPQYDRYGNRVRQ